MSGPTIRIGAPQREAALKVLQGRERLPNDPAEWGRAWGFARGEAHKMVRDEERRRRKL